MVVSAVVVIVIVVFGVDKGSFMLLLPLGPTVDLSFFLDSGPSGTGIFADGVCLFCTLCVFCSFGGSFFFFLVLVPGCVLFMVPAGLLYRMSRVGGDLGKHVATWSMFVPGLATPYDVIVIQE